MKWWDELPEIVEPAIKYEGQQYTVIRGYTFRQCIVAFFLSVERCGQPFAPRGTVVVSDDGHCSSCYMRLKQDGSFEHAHNEWDDPFIGGGRKIEG